jgi:heat shock protein HslJ
MKKNLVAILTFGLTLSACAGLPPAPPPAITRVAAPAAGAAGLQVDQITLDAQGLWNDWDATLVPPTPYDDSQPPGPTGLPEHVVITFGGTQAAALTPSDPAMYIIPVTAYEAQWRAAGNDSVSRNISWIYTYTVALPQPPPVSNMPALPPEQVGGGVNDLATQIGRVPPQADGASKSGFRFIGRWAQDATPVTNQNLRYVYQGFTNDGVYLVTFFSPITTTALPDAAGDVPAEQMQALQTDPAAYLSAQAAALDALAPADWQPNLDQLDAVVASLRIAGMPAYGLQGPVWKLVAQRNGTVEQPLDNPENYTVVFNPDGTLVVQADCNRVIGAYTAEGGSVGSLRTQLGPSTLAACGPDSHADLLVNVLVSAQDYKVRPGGADLELIQPAGGTVLIFVREPASGA